MQAGSIRTHNEQRDNDLRASNFLEVDKYPTITFKSTKIEPAGPDRFTMTGDLTIKGNTRPVTFSVVKYGEFNDPMMGHRIGYSAETKINRKEFGLTFNMMLDGKFIVSDEVQIMIEGEFVEQKQE
jgi:polyisoprenoid-binding protein YceI